jgi:hypothetical protein
MTPFSMELLYLMRNEQVSDDLQYSGELGERNRSFNLPEKMFRKQLMAFACVLQFLLIAVETETLVT